MLLFNIIGNILGYLGLLFFNKLNATKGMVVKNEQDLFFKSL